MRYVCLRTFYSWLSLLLLLSTTGSAIYGQALNGTPAQLSIANYQLVSTSPISAKQSTLTYRADAVNTGVALSTVIAKVSSGDESRISVVPGAEKLVFGKVPAQGTASSLGCFSILVDNTVPLDLTLLHWTFQGPLANAGNNQIAQVGSTVSLNAIGSSNPTGLGTLAYRWEFASRPADSSSILQNSDSVMPRFKLDKAGTYVVKLTVDNGTATDTASVVVSTVQTAPVADPGANQTAAVGSTVILNGSNSSDVNGKLLSYAWQLIQQPKGSTAKLAGSDGVLSSFVVDQPGTYLAQLTVSDGSMQSAPATVIVTSGNTPPLAVAGPNQILATGALAQLNGTGSTDVDGDPLSYRWSMLSVPVGSTAKLSDPTTADPTFTLDVPGTYVAQLVVNDGHVDSIPSTVAITTNAVLPPIANAGVDQQVTTGSMVHLSGTGTDLQGLKLAYQWALISKPPASMAALNNATDPNPAFVADVSGVYIAQLIVSNSQLNSVASTVMITTTNTIPVADAGPNQNVSIGSTVALDGSGSFDADHDPLSYTWSFLSQPAGSSATLLASQSSSPTFQADVAGLYVVQLIARDAVNTSRPATVTIAVVDSTAISLQPDPLNMFTAGSGILTIMLPAPAGAGGQTVYLSSSNAAVATVPATVTIPANVTGTNVLVKAGNATGISSVTASAPGFVSGAATISVAPPAVALSLSAGTVNLSGTIQGTVQLNAPAPAGGMLVVLSSLPSDLVDLPPSVSIPGGSTTATFNIIGKAVGSTGIRASISPYVQYTTAPLTVSSLGSVFLQSGASVPLSQATRFSVSLQNPAPAGGVSVSLSSSDTSKLTVNPAVMTIPAGQTTPDPLPLITGVGLGDAVISATAPGYSADSKKVQVIATLSFATSAVTINGLGHQDLTLNLSVPAPYPGLIVNLSSSDSTIMSPQTTSVTFLPGVTSVPVSVVASGLGTATLHASSTYAPDATATVTVAMGGGIQIFSGQTVGQGSSDPFGLSLPYPATSPVVVTLTSSNPAVLTVTPTATVFPGNQTPSQSPLVTGVSVGSATITASAPGYTSGTQTLQVIVGMTFVPAFATITGTATQNLTLTVPTPTGGLTVNLSSSDTSVATVPASVTFAPTATSVIVPVTGVHPGTATIHANTFNGPDRTAGITVVNSPAIVLQPNVTVALAHSAAFPIALPTPAPQNGVTVQLTSSDSSKVTISPSTVTISAGQTTPATQPQVTGVNVGSANIAASASGYTSSSQAVAVTGSIGFSPNSATIATAGSQALTLNLSAPAPAGGLTINISSSNPSVAAVPSTVNFAANATSTSVLVTGGIPGAAIIHASALPAIPDATAGVTVVSFGSIVLPSGLTVGLTQSQPLTVSLTAPAPAGGATIALLSGDPSKVTIDPATITIAGGQTSPTTPPQITGVSLGSTTITASAPGFASSSQAVQVTASLSFSPQTVNIRGTATENLSLMLSAPAPAGGLTVTLSSENAGVATVPATVTFAANASTATVAVTGIALGTTKIHASALPNVPDAAATVTVLPPTDIVLARGVTVQPGQATPMQVTLANPAPQGGLVVSLSSSDITKVTVNTPNVIFAPGATTPSSDPIVNGIDFGSATITASALGLSGDSAAVNVIATVNFVPSSVTLIGTATQNLTLNLSTPAPPEGVTIQLSSTKPGAATVPATVTFDPGATSVTVPVTGVAPGTTTIHASSAPNIADATASVTVVAPGTIGLPANMTVGPTQSASFAVTLGTPAPTGGVTVTLSSSDISKVTISPGTVTIATGQTTPATQPQVTGVNYGTANISASAIGYTTASQPVSVSATASFTPTTLSIIGTATQSLTLTLSAPAPTGGVTINLSSSNTATATVPATVTIAANANTASVPVTGVAPGTTTIHANSTPNIADTTASVTVAAPGTIGLPSNVTVGPTQSASFAVTLGTPAPTGGVTVTLTSSDTSRVTISPGIVTIAAGQTTPATQPQVTGVNYGTSNISASATGYTTASQPVTVAATASFTPTTLSIVGTATQNLTLTLSAPAPAGGVTINLSSSNTAAATVAATVNIAANANSATVAVTGVAPGTTTIHASSTPNIADTTASVTVVAPGSIGLPANVTVGPTQAATFAVTLGTPAPAGGVTVTLTSSDTSKVTISPGTVTVAAGQTTPAAQPQVTGVNYGTANISASATGYTTASQPVTVAATASFSPTTLSITGTATQNLTLTLSAPAPAGGVTINLSSSNIAAATVPASVTIAANTKTATVAVTGVAPGTTTIHASSTPNIADTTASVTVVAPGSIGLPANVTVGPTQSAAFAVTLGTPAPAGGVTVTLTSNDTSKVTISPGTVTIAAGQTTPAAQPQVTGVNYGTANISAGATGYTTASQPVTVAATATFSPTTLSITGTATQNLTLTLSAPAPAGGVTINLSSSNTAAATVPATVAIAANATTATVAVTGVAPGTTTIHASSTPNIADTTAAVTVVGTIGLASNVTVGPTQSATFTVTLGTAAPAGGVTVTLTSSDTSKVTIAPGTLLIAAGQTTPATQPQVTGVNYGTANISAAATGYTTASQPVTVAATASFSPNTLSINGTATQNLTLTLSAPAPAGGVTINLSSSNTGTATVPATVTVAANATSTSVPVTGVAPGTTTIHASSTPNIADTTAAITVVGTISLPANVTVGPTQQATFSVTLVTPAPTGGVTVTLTSSDTSKVTVSPGTVTIAAGQTTPAAQPKVTGVNYGSANISATATGYTTASQPVTVAATASFSPNTITITGTATQNLTLTLSAPAPAGGVTFNVSSSNTAAATVPASVTIAANASSTTVAVTGVAPGTATIHASSASIPDTTAAITVNSAGGTGTVTLTGGTIGQNLEIGTTLNLSVPAGSGSACQPQPAACLTVTLTSSDPTKLVIAGHATDTGGPSLSIPVSQGVTALTGIYVQALGNSGTVNITVSAPGYTGSTTTYTLAASGIVISGPNGIGGLTATTNQGLSTSLSVFAAQLDSSLNYVQTQQLRGGFSASVNVTSSNTTVGTITTSPVTINGGDPSGSTTFNALQSGATTVAAVAPSGFSAPAGGFDSVAFTVNPTGLVPPTGLVVGKLLQTSTQIGLNGVAPSQGLLVTVTVTDSTKLLLSTTGTDAGSPSITLTVKAGLAHTPQFFVYGLASSGTSDFNASAGTFGSTTATVALAPSGAILSGPNGAGVNFLTASNSPASTLTVLSALLDSGLNFVAVQAMAGNSSMSVTVTSSNTTVGTIVSSPVTISAGNSSATTLFQPASSGSSTLAASAAGFSVPVSKASLTVTVATPAFALTDGITVGQNGEEQGTVIIGQQAGAGGQAVTLTSNNPSQLLLSATASGAGSASITVTIPAGSNNTTFFIQVTGSIGNVTYTASAAGFANKTATITQVPSGLVVFSPLQLPFYSTTVAAGPASFIVAFAQLNADGSFNAMEQVAGGSSATANLTSSNTGVATISSPVIIAGGSMSNTATFTPKAAGSTTISITNTTATTNGSVAATVN